MGVLLYVETVRSGCCRHSCQFNPEKTCPHRERNLHRPRKHIYTSGEVTAQYYNASRIEILWFAKLADFEEDSSPCKAVKSIPNFSLAIPITQKSDARHDSVSPSGPAFRCSSFPVCIAIPRSCLTLNPTFLDW
jgi:hypothetical protein